MAPASRSFFTAVESIGAMKSKNDTFEHVRNHFAMNEEAYQKNETRCDNLPLRIVDAADDWRPFVRMLSLIAIGIPSSFDLGMSNRNRTNLWVDMSKKRRFTRNKRDDLTRSIQLQFWLTLLDTLLRLLCFSQGFILVADVDVGVEVAASTDILIGLLDELRAREHVCLH